MARLKGSKLSAKHKANIANAMSGNQNTLNKSWGWSGESKERIKGRKMPDRNRFKKGRKAWNKGKKMPESMRDKMRIFATNRIGEQSANWRGGASFLPYLPVFNKKLKLEIRTRDKFICQLCGIKESDHYEKLAIHHIDYDKTHNDSNNLITLCRACNAKVNFQREKWTTFFSEKIKELNTNAV